MKIDGTEWRKISDTAVFDPFGVSHDGRWLLAQTRGPDRENIFAVAAFPIDGGSNVTVCLNLCFATWDRIGKFLYVGLNSSESNTYALSPAFGSSKPTSGWYIER